MKKGKLISSVSLLLVLLTAAFAVSPPAGQNYAVCTTPGGSLTTRADLVFTRQQPDEPDIPEYQDCILTFLPNNGQENIIQTVHAGTVVTPPEIQEREGYTFDGWFTDGHPADFAEPVRQNTTFAAKWTPVTNDDPYAVGDDVCYTVEHYHQTLDNAYVLAGSQQFTGKENTLVTADVQSYTGFTENPDHPGRAASGVLHAGEPLVLRLYYDRNVYRVTIDPGDGKIIELEVRHGDLIPKPETDPKRDGAVFNGWIDRDTQKPVDWNEPVTGSRNITALFQTKKPGGSGSHGGSGGGSGGNGSSGGGSSNTSTDRENPPKDEMTDSILNKKDHIPYINGYPDGTVRPMKNITRGEVAQIIYRLMQSDYREAHSSITNPYTDVDQSVWCNAAVSTLTDAGLLKGYRDGTFRCGRTITRAEFVTVMSRFFAFSGSRECLFTDIDPHWAKTDIEKAASLGYIRGKTSTTFDPNAPITRAEAAAILNRVLERGTKAEFMLEDMKQWPDNPAGAWYYEDIQEASNGHDYRNEDGREVWTGIAGLDERS